MLTQLMFNVSNKNICFFYSWSANRKTVEYLCYQVNIGSTQFINSSK